MHIPDGFLSTPTWAMLDVVSAPAIGYLARRAQAETEEHRAPLLGVMGAFVFAAQMINFPVGVGTSGHLVGSALLAVTLGPAAAAVVMTAILAVQALIFQDGGLLALGANVFNMAVVGVLAGYLPYHYWGAHWRRTAVFAGGALSVLAAALLTVAELLISGVPMPGPVLAVSLGLFVIMAVIEGAMTVVVLQTIEAMNPAWVRRPGASNRRVAGALAIASLLAACVGALFASSLPDGLDVLAERIGLAEHARNLVETPLADYELRGVGPEWLRKSLAGLTGLAAIYAVCFMLWRFVLRRRSS